MDTERVRAALAARGALAPKRAHHLAQPLRTGVAALDECGHPLCAGGVLSVVGPSGAGKTQLLLRLAAAALRARRDVVYVACTTPLDRARLRQLCAAYPGEEGADAASAEQGDVHAYRAASGLQLLALLTSLTAWVRTRAGARVGLVCVDGLGATHYGDRLAGRGEAVARWLLRLVRAAPHCYLAASECALHEQQRVHCAPPLESPITRPGRFMPRQWGDAVTHTVVLYGAEERRGALLLHEDRVRRNARPQLVAAGELLVGEGDVELRTMRGATCTLTESCR